MLKRSLPTLMNIKPLYAVLLVVGLLAVVIGGTVALTGGDAEKANEAQRLSDKYWADYLDAAEKADYFEDKAQNFNQLSNDFMEMAREVPDKVRQGYMTKAQAMVDLDYYEAKILECSKLANECAAKARDYTYLAEDYKHKSEYYAKLAEEYR